MAASRGRDLARHQATPGSERHEGKAVESSLVRQMVRPIPQASQLSGAKAAEACEARKVELEGPLRAGPTPELPVPAAAKSGRSALSSPSPQRSPTG